MVSRNTLGKNPFEDSGTFPREIKEIKHFKNVFLLVTNILGAG